MIRKDVYFTLQQIKRIEREMKTTGLSFSELLRRIVDLYFEQRDR